MYLFGLEESFVFEKEGSMYLFVGDMVYIYIYIYMYVCMYILSPMNRPCEWVTERVQVLLSIPFTKPCAIYVL